MTIVYIDQFLIINIVLNYILLYITKKIIRSNSSNPRLFLGSVIGALYAAFMFLPQTQYMYSFIGKFIFSLILIAITYNIKRIKVYFRAVGVFYLISFIFGGSAFAIMNFVNSSNNKFTFGILITSSVVAYCFITLISSYYKRYTQKESKFAKLTINFNNKVISINSLIDTGNFLYDPLSSLPVIVAEFESVCNLFPDEICDVFKNKMPTEIIINAFTRCGLSNKFRLIPYKSIGDENGMIIGFRPDSVYIDDSVVGGCIIGLHSRRLSTDDSYFALINPQVFV